MAQEVWTSEKRAALHCQPVPLVITLLFDAPLLLGSSCACSVCSYKWLQYEDKWDRVLEYSNRRLEINPLLSF